MTNTLSAPGSINEQEWQDVKMLQCFRANTHTHSHTDKIQSHRKAGSLHTNVTLMKLNTHKQPLGKSRYQSLVNTEL